MANFIKRWDTKVGYSAFILEYYGNLMGYVNVPKKHPWYGKKSDERVPINLSKEPVGDRSPLMLVLMACDESVFTNPRIDYIIDVHGSITYSNCNWDTKDSWCFGFDCNHYNDTPEYWNVDRVTEEVERLAEQLKKYEPKEAPDAVAECAQ